MGAVTDLLSPQLAIAWTIYAAWCIGQFGWYRRVRIEPAPAPPPRRTDSARRVAVPPRPVPALPTGGSSEFLAQLGLQNATAQDGPPKSVYR